MQKNDSFLLGIQYPTKSCPHCLLSRHACLFTFLQTDKPALTLRLLFLLLGPRFSVYASGFSLTFFMSCVKSHLVRTCHYWKPYTYPPSSRRSLFFLVYMNYLWIDVKVVPYLSPTQGHCFWDYPFYMLKLINFPSLLHHCSQRVRSEVKVTQSWSDSLWPHGLYSSWNSPSRKTKIKLLVFSVCHLFPLKALHTNFLLDYDFLEELCIFTIFWSCFTISIALTTLVHH